MTLYIGHIQYCDGLLSSLVWWNGFLACMGSTSHAEQGCTDRHTLSSKIHHSKPKLILTLAQKSFSMRETENWPQTPSEIRCQAKMVNFKKLAKRWILENVPTFLQKSHHWAMHQKLQWTNIFKVLNKTIMKVVLKNGFL